MMDDTRCISQALSVHWVPAEVRHQGVDSLIDYLRTAYKDELQNRHQDDLEEQIEEELEFGTMKRAKAVDSLKDGRYEDAREEVKAAEQAFETALDLHNEAQAGVSDSATLLEEHEMMRERILDMIDGLSQMIDDIEQRRGGVNRREFIDRKIRAEVDAHEEDPNPYDVEGWSRLHYAAKWGLVDRINMLLGLGAEVNCTVKKGPYIGRTPHDLSKDEKTKHCLHAHGGVPCFQLKYLTKPASFGIASLAAGESVGEDEVARERDDAIELLATERESNRNKSSVREKPRGETAKAGYTDRPASATKRLPAKELQTSESPHTFLKQSGALRHRR